MYKNMSKDYYEILGVTKDSTPDEIKKAYRNKAKEHHPDKGGDEEIFKEISEAYETLSDPQKKSSYDMYGSSGNQFGAGGFGNMEDIFSQFGDIFGQFGGQFGGRRQRRGNDIRVRVNVNLNDIINGSSKNIKYRRNVKCDPCGGLGGTEVVTCKSCGGKGQRVVVQQSPIGRIQQVVTCDECQGEGKSVKNKCVSCNGSGAVSKDEITDINIPAGVLGGMQLSIPDGGHYIKNGVNGDLHIFIEEIADDKFKREGGDLIYDDWISISDAVLGCDLSIDTPTGKVNINVPNGCESGKTFRIRGKGIPNISGNGHVYGYGDMNIRVNVKIPKITTAEQKEAFVNLKNIL